MSSSVSVWQDNADNVGRRTGDSGTASVGMVSGIQEREGEEGGGGADTLAGEVESLVESEEDAPLNSSNATTVLLELTTVPPPGIAADSNSTTGEAPVRTGSVMMACGIRTRVQC